MLGVGRDAWCGFGEGWLSGNAVSVRGCVVYRGYLTSRKNEGCMDTSKCAVTKEMRSPPIFGRFLCHQKMQVVNNVL